MAPSKSTLLLLSIFLLFAEEVSSFDHEKLKIKMNYEKPQVPPDPFAAQPPGAAPPPVMTPTRRKFHKFIFPRKSPELITYIDCGPACERRCKLRHSRKREVCETTCMKCCDRCKCVPPGTSGNRNDCGKCYTDMFPSGNGLHCP